MMQSVRLRDMVWIRVIFTSCFGEDISSGILGRELRDLTSCLRPERIFFVF